MCQYTRKEINIEQNELTCAQEIFKYNSCFYGKSRDDHYFHSSTKIVTNRILSFRNFNTLIKTAVA